MKNPITAHRVQGAAIGVAAALILGFTWGGWVTGATARKMASQSATAAAAAALAPNCVAKFQAAGDDLKAFKEKSSWSQDSYLTEKKYAPDSDVAKACVALLNSEQSKG